MSIRKTLKMISTYEMFLIMLAVHCDQNSSNEINMNGYQARKINETRTVIFGLQPWETFHRVKVEVGMFTKLSTSSGKRSFLKFGRIQNCLRAREQSINSQA